MIRSARPSPLTSPAPDTLQPDESPASTPSIRKPRSPRLPRSTSCAATICGVSNSGESARAVLIARVRAPGGFDGVCAAWLVMIDGTETTRSAVTSPINAAKSKTAHAVAWDLHKQDCDSLNGVAADRAMSSQRTQLELRPRNLARRPTKPLLLHRTAQKRVAAGSTGG